MDRNTLQTTDGVVNKHIRGEISKPLLRAWMDKGVNPISTALEAIIEVAKYRHLQDFLFLSICCGVVGTFFALLLGFSFYPPLQPIAYGIGFITLVTIVIAIVVSRSLVRETTYRRWAQEFIDAYDQFVWVTSSEQDERFTKLKYEELKERAHETLAKYALQVREIEVAGEGIAPIHWEQHKKNAAEVFEKVYRLMQSFKFVGNEGYKPYYAMADELLKQRQPTT